MVKSAPVKNSTASLNRYLKEAQAELKKVHWPTRQQTAKMTLVVIAVSLLVGVLIGGLDYLFTELVGLILK